MVSGPLRAPPSLWKTGRSELGGLGGAVSHGSALWFWKAKSEARGEGGSSEDGWGPKWGAAAFSSRTLGGHGRASAPRPWLGLSVSPYLLGAAIRDPMVFSRAFPSPFPCFWRARARALHALTSSSARNGEAGRSPTQKRRRDRYLPARERRETAPAVCACASRCCGSTTVGRCLL